MLAVMLGPTCSAWKCCYNQPTWKSIRCSSLSQESRYTEESWLRQVITRVGMSPWVCIIHACLLSPSASKVTTRLTSQDSGAILAYIYID